MYEFIRRKPMDVSVSVDIRVCRVDVRGIAKKAHLPPNSATKNTSSSAAAVSYLWELQCLENQETGPQTSHQRS